MAFSHESCIRVTEAGPVSRRHSIELLGEYSTISGNLKGIRQAKRRSFGFLLSSRRPAGATDERVYHRFTGGTPTPPAELYGYIPLLYGLREEWPLQNREGVGVIGKIVSMQGLGVFSELLALRY